MNSPSDPLIGNEIDGYLIERLLGKGGMARVYRGQDVRLGRYVAIKVIEPTARTNPDYTARFQKEARAVAQLQHPHIVSVYRFGEVNGLFYMAMQYIDGTDLGWVLGDYAKDGELIQHPDVLHIVSQIGSALDYAHSKGVIHRDVKPSNVMLDRDGRAILTDFGLALVRTEGTRGETFGTPQYIAPEQAVTSAGVVPESDQYSLGVMLYEMLTGGLPFDGPSPMDVAMAHMTDPLPSPLERNPDLHPAFANILERVLQKDPADRYPSCAVLAAVLEHAIREQGQQPVTLSRISTLAVPEQVQEFRAANPLPPLPAVAVAQSPTTHRRPAEAKTRRVAPLRTNRPPSNQYRLWIFVAMASTLVVIAGILAVIALISSGKNAVSPTATSAILASELSPSPEVAESTETSVPILAQTLAEAPPTAWIIMLPTMTSMPATVPTLVPTASIPTVPTATPRVYLLTIMTQRQDSLFIVNSGESAFPLSFIRVGDGDGAINGDEWGVDLLPGGSCVAAWKDAGNPRAANVDCSQVGARITRDGRNRFWRSAFSVYYNGVQVGTCSSEGCVISIAR